MGPYANPSTQYTESTCLDNTIEASTLARRRTRKKSSKKKSSSKEETSYTFTIEDSGRNGLCCRYGNGSYTITINGEVIAESGTNNKFKSSQKSTFTINQTP